MAQNVYDPDADTRPAHGTEEDDPLKHIDPREEAEMEAQARSGAKEDIAARESLFNPGGDSPSRDSSAESRDDLSDDESGGDASSLYNKGGDDEGGGLRGRASRARARNKNRLATLRKNKWLVGGAVGGGGSVAALIIVLIILGGSLKLPGVTQNIESYEFARATRQFANSATETTDESLAVEAAGDGVYSQLKEKFAGKYQDIRSSTWGKLDAYRPSQVVKNLGENNGLELKFTASKIPGRGPIFTGASFNGADYNVKPVTGIAKWTPGVRQILQAKNEAAVRANLLSDVVDTMKANQTGALIRGPVAYQIRQAAGGSLAGWALEKFKGKNEEQARVVETQERVATTQAGQTIPDNASTAEIAAADEAAAEAERTAAGDVKAVAAANANSGDVPAVLKAADGSLDSNLLKKVLDIGDPVYAIVTPICIIYDGSVQQSQPSIDNQSNQQENTFDLLAAQADQQKLGDQNTTDGAELAAAIGATNDQIGDVSESIPYQRLSTGLADTTDIDSAEAGADGGYNFTLLNALGLSSGSFAGKAADYIAGNTCGVLTSYYTAGAIAGANLILAIISFGGTEAGEEAAGQGARAFVTTFVKKIVSNVFSKQVEKQGIKTIERGSLNRVQRFVFKQGLIAGGTYGLTELAHLVVAHRSGEANSGFAQGTDLVNEADAGANIEANKIEQQQLFGRPLDSSDLGASLNADLKYVGDANASKSFTDRYFATSNANSLVSRMAIDVSSLVRPSLIASITNLGSSLLHPLSAFASVFSMSGIVHAAPDPNTQYYGNVQFGWSEAEENLVHSSDSYKPLENQFILDQNGREADIASKYSLCFGYKYDSGGNGDLDPTDSAGNLQPDLADYSIGHLLAKGYITRNSQGHVTNDGLCSPKNLGSGNNEFGLQMVFRWRLAMRYYTTINQLTAEQNAEE